jgi:Rps23 Pro-64 3,4-dihydroxylase Tpa1-like proline 4-hydroxylase
MINPEHSFEKEGNIISVKNFFKTDFIDKIQSDLKNIDKTWWHVSLNPIDIFGKKQFVRFYEGLYDNRKFIEEKEFNKSWFNRGNFAYSFKRSMTDHHNGCWCVMCKLKEYFESDEIKDAVSKIIGEKVTNLNETFCSKYETNDYLSIHHDKGKGDYAFVLQLTKDWNPSYGGLLTFCDRSTNEIYKTVNPLFNSLTIFRIKNVPNTDHFVSMNVSSHTRYAFTGWFTVSETCP